MSSQNPTSPAADPVDQNTTTNTIVIPSDQSQNSQPIPTAPVNPFNPLKRQLSDNMEALIAQAKASKTEAGSSARADLVLFRGVKITVPARRAVE
ncbi:hypothetical protein ABW20_dc0104699 [Dactylellina cionopaga]|nr:hypothetical protein ABW20_dc0104699 [Dactylellina cionopaga]